MTHKRYLHDSYSTSFTTDIESVETGDSGVVLQLKETLFYPESGGPPADRGSIGSARVTDVQLDGETVLHYLDSEPEDGAQATIDWSRRHDHMQQHTGQHLLTAAAFRLFEADTVGFHLGERVSTIDITMAEISDEQIAALENQCQDWIVAALPVEPRFVSSEEFEQLDLRKKNLPDHVSGDIRLIAIEGIDICNCGGTHLRSTAEIQTIKIVASEKVRDTTRLHFLAGSRAIRDYDQKHILINELALHFTTGIEDLKQIILKQQRENKLQSSQIKHLQKQLAESLATAELANAESRDGHRWLIKQYPELSADQLRLLAQGITRLDSAAVFAGLVEEEERATLICAAGDDYQGDLGPVVKAALPAFNGKGGGRGSYAQAVGETGKSEAVLRIITETVEN